MSKTKKWFQQREVKAEEGEGDIIRDWVALVIQEKAKIHR